MSFKARAMVVCVVAVVLLAVLLLFHSPKKDNISEFDRLMNEDNAKYLANRGEFDRLMGDAQTERKCQELEGQGRERERTSINDTHSYDVATDCWRKAADEGFAKAQFRMGTLYKEGKWIEKDYAQAVKFFEKAAEQGNLRAAVELGISFELGLGVEQSNEEAFKLYLQAAEKETPNLGWGVIAVNAACFAGRMYSLGKGVERNFVEAEKWFQKGGGFWYCKERLDRLLPGEILHNSNYVALTNFDEIHLSRQRGFFGGPVYSVTVNDEGRVTYKGQERVKRIGTATATLSAKQLAGLLEAVNAVEYPVLSQNNYSGECSSDSTYAKTSVTVGGKEYSINHYHGNCSAGTGLVSGFERSIDEIVGVEQWIGTPRERHMLSPDYRNQQRELCSKAMEKKDLRLLNVYADLGSAVAQYVLGSLYLDGEFNQEPDLSKAIEWFLRAATQGNDDAQAKLGDIYKQGKSLDSREEAYFWHALATTPDRHDYSGAQDEIAKYLSQERLHLLEKRIEEWDPKIETPSETESEEVLSKWLVGPANQGDVQAQLNLGILYRANHFGFNIKVDGIKSFQWLRKAAEKNNREAQRWLAVLHEGAPGVPRDMKEIYFWYSLSSDGGNDKHLASVARTAAGNLSPQEKADVDSRVMKWNLEHP
jgi:uncharacterized protein